MYDQEAKADRPAEYGATRQQIKRFAAEMARLRLGLTTLQTEIGPVLRPLPLLSGEADKCVPVRDYCNLAEEIAAQVDELEQACRVLESLIDLVDI